MTICGWRKRKDESLLFIGAVDAIRFLLKGEYATNTVG